jgi:hypothetical protein
MAEQYAVGDKMALIIMWVVIIIFLFAIILIIVEFMFPYHCILDASGNQITHWC